MSNVLIIGAGSIALRHIAALSKIPEVKIVGVCDIVREKAESLAAQTNAEALTNFKTAIDKLKPDYVILLTPRGFREPVINACVESMTPIFMEKPPCDRISTGERIAEILETSGLIHTVGFMRRWNDALNTVLAQISSQMISTIEISYQCPFATSPVWQSYPAPYLVEQSGGLVGDQGIHYIDICRYITGAEPYELYAAGTNQILPISKNVTTRDTVSWCMIMTNGTVVSHSHTWCAPGWACNIRIVTDRSIVSLDMFGGTATGMINDENFNYQSQTDEFELEHRAFAEAVKTQDMSNVRSPYKDALKSFRIAAEINRLLYGHTTELD